MKSVNGKIAIVTGAASGIGRATALALSHAGANVILCDVDEANLAMVAKSVGGRCLLARCVDVGSADAMRAFADEVHEAFDTADILVNNAGVGMAGGLLGTTLEDWEWVLRVNLWGVIHGCHVFVPRMVERCAGGHVVNVSSTLGFFAAPEVIGYSTSKFAVLGLSESLRGELAPHGVGVSAVCPGIVATNIIAKTRFTAETPGDGRRARAASVFAGRAFSPEKVARAILHAITRNTAVAPVSPEAWALYYLKRILPSAGGPLGRALSKHAMG